MKEEILLESRKRKLQDNNLIRETNEWKTKKKEQHMLCKYKYK